MKTSEKFTVFGSIVAAFLPIATTAGSLMMSLYIIGVIVGLVVLLHSTKKTVFPIVYQISADKFQVINKFIPERSEDICGYQLISKSSKEKGLILMVGSEKEYIDWFSAKASGNKIIDGFEGSMPAKSVSEFLTKKNVKKIFAMEDFLTNRGVDLKKKSSNPFDLALGCFWSCEDSVYKGREYAHYVNLSGSYHIGEHYKTSKIATCFAIAF